MARPKSAAPSLRHHISGQSVCDINGRTYYLGKHDSPESLARYAVLVATYQRNGLSLPDGFDIESLGPQVATLLGPVTLVADHQEDSPVLVSHLVADYKAYIEKRYADSHQDRERRLQVTSWLMEHDSELPVDKFGPRKLHEYRERLDDGTRSRRYLNRLTNEIRKVFKHGVARELVPPNVLVGLKALMPLVAGEAGFELARRKAVPLEHVRETAKHCSPIVRDMLTVQLATGMRPSEVCTMRPIDIDRTGNVWLYKPENHKLAWKGIEKEVPILGEARSAIENYLNRRSDMYMFSPAESMAWLRAKQRSERQGYGSYRKHVAEPKKKPGDKYTSDSYRQALTRAAKLAKVPAWTPYQVRHLVGTTVADVLPLESSKALLGHQDLATTQIYAKATTRMAIEAAKRAPTIRHSEGTE